MPPPGFKPKPLYSAMLDHQCPRCRKRFGWKGTMLDCPPCPSCGTEVPRADLLEGHRQLTEFHEQLREIAERRKAAEALTKDAKVCYVKKQRQTRPHTCHWPGCGKQCPPAKWGCYQCWMRLPKYLRDKIWAAYCPGQEVDATPSRQYVAVAREVQEWIAEHYPVSS